MRNKDTAARTALLSIAREDTGRLLDSQLYEVAVANFTTAVHVLALTDAGVQVATFSSSAESFWLPRTGDASWASPPEPGRTTTVVVAEWLASKHRPLVEEMALQRVRHSTHAKGKASWPHPSTR
jgi:hypothetical protein